MAFSSIVEVFLTDASQLGDIGYETRRYRRESLLALESWR